MFANNNNVPLQRCADCGTEITPYGCQYCAGFLNGVLKQFRKELMGVPSHDNVPDEIEAQHDPATYEYAGGDFASEKRT